MLTTLTTSNFAIVKQLELSWYAGLSTITGETGAGKSISIDALMFCLGARADSKKVRPGTDRAVVSASFNIETLPLAKNYLVDNGFDVDGGDCILRRIINTQGRSKAFINGHCATTAQLKFLGELLISIHGQHAHQKITKSTEQRLILDAISEHSELVEPVATLFNQYDSLMSQKKRLTAASIEFESRAQLLTYQVEELDKFNPFEGEYEDVDAEQKKLTHGSELRENSQKYSYQLLDSDDNSIVSLLERINSGLNELAEMDPALIPLVERFSGAVIEIEDASKELSRYSDSVDVNPQRLNEVEDRLSQYIDLARKHGVKPENIHITHTHLCDELSNMKQKEDQLEEVERLLTTTHDELLKASKKLSQSRIKSAKNVSNEITLSMQTLNMEGGEFEVRVIPNDSMVKSHGIDDISFYVSANPGQPLQAIGKVASGGELSRISLALQVCVAKCSAVASLVFDEVDVGISGNTAAVVGKLLRELGKKTQVISITHLPQVASCADNHYLVTKSHSKIETQTSMFLLDKKGQTNEIARLLGGEIITEEALRNADQLIKEGTYCN
jgi:DNA repair protein RecN (Recombination protein N)